MTASRNQISSLLALSLLTLTATGFGGSAGADSTMRRASLRHPSNVGGEGRSGPASPLIANNFEVVSHLQLGGRAADGDVFHFDHGPGVGHHVYVGTWTVPCTRRGVKVVDANDPAHPALVSVARLNIRDVSYEDPVVIRIGGRVVLAVGVQICGARGKGGLGLFDVTDPHNPARLAFLKTRSYGVHELDLTTLPDGRTAALLAVPYGELEEDKDLLIVDISDPAHPARISGWGQLKNSSLPIPNVTNPPSDTSKITTCCQGMGVDFADLFLHSARAADGGRTAYISYWDLGVLKFDLSDPAHPRLVGRTPYAFDDEGEAHSIATYDTGGVRYILQNDEDFNPMSPAHVQTSATGERTWAVLDEPWMPKPLARVGPIHAKIHDAGKGCVSSDFEGARGKVALADLPDGSEGQRAACGLAHQIVLAADAGAKAFMFNLLGPNRPTGLVQPPPQALGRIERAARSMPVLGVASIDGLARTIRRAKGPVRMSLRPGTPEYGYLRVFSEASGTDTDGDGVVEYAQVGEFTGLPHVRGELSRSKAVWSIHNTEVWGNRSFSSWYAHGIVALDLTNPAQPVLVGQFAPPGDVGRVNPQLPRATPSVWGVALDSARGLVYASDMRSGLWIVRPKPPASPSIS
jgi:hypothetical protein